MTITSLKSLTQRARRAVAPLAALGCALASTLGVASSARAQVVWEDDFPAGQPLDTSKWQMSDDSNYIHRTRFGGAPQVLTEGGTSFARLSLNTYNPNPARSGNSTLGTEMKSKVQWSVGTGLEWEARIRAGAGMPKGIVYAFFTYRERDFGRDNDQEEIDFEFLSNWLNTPADSDKVWTNIWNGRDYKSESAPRLTGLNHFGWNTFTMRWTAGEVKWLINGNQVRSETNPLYVPDDRMGAFFNIWTPDPGWPLAYDGGLPTASSASANRSTHLDVDYIRVRRLPAPTNQGSIGSGGGLSTFYHNGVSFNSATQSVQFSNQRIADISPRINFNNWGTTSFDARLNDDGWGGLYRGQLQAQVSGPTTFYINTHSTDGVRLYLNNELIIDKRAGTGDTIVESSVTRTLAAGTLYAIRIEFYEGAGRALLQLQWSNTSGSPSLAKQLVPMTQLYPLLLPTPVLSPSPGTYSTAQNVSISVNEAGADIHYTLDGSEPQRSNATIASGSTVTISSPRTLRARAWKDGYWSSDVVGGVYTIYTDTQAPALTISSPVNTFSYRSVAGAGGAVTDAGDSGLDRVTVRLSQNNSVFWNGPATVTGTIWSVAFPALADGLYTVRAQAFDRVGNASVEAVASFYIDNVAPTATIDTPAAGGAFASLSSASGSASDVGPGVESVRATLRRGDGAYWNGAEWSGSPADFAATLALPAWSLSLPALGDGAYTLSVVARDYVGNASAPAERAFSIDTIAPVVLIAQPTDNLLSRTAVNLIGSASDPGSGVAGVVARVRRDADGAYWFGGGWTGAETEVPASTYAGASGAGSADWSLILPQFGDGSYSALIIARDRVGNASQNTVRWRVDATAPSVAIDSPIGGSTSSTWVAPRGSVGDALSGVASVDITLRSGGAYWNGTAWNAAPSSVRASSNGISWSWPGNVSLPPVANGAYEVTATATDVAGNTGTAQVNSSIALPVPTPVPTAVPTATPVPAPVDRESPRVVILSPGINSSARTIGALRGTVSDNVGVASVSVSLYRYADRRYWTGRAWSATATSLSPQVVGGSWSYGSVPTGVNAPSGAYAVNATVVDRAGLRASAVLSFRVDLRAPAISFALPLVPISRVISVAPTKISVRAQDDAGGTRLVDVMLWRGDGRYWNGRAWLPGVLRLPLRGVNLSRGSNPSAVLWENAWTMPPASQWLPGSYTVIAIARDWASNQSEARLNFTLAPPSSLVFSSSSASAANSTVSLAFTGALGAAVQNPSLFSVRVGGVARTVLAARLSNVGRGVTLSLAGSIVPGARIEIAWRGLRDSQGRTIRDGSSIATAG